MNKIEEEKLDLIYGGSNTISGTIINAITGVIKVLYDAGHAFGSSIRRISEDKLCSIK